MGYDLEQMLFTIPPENRSPETIGETLRQHPEVKFVSVVGLDLAGHDTDEKIPVREFLDDIPAFLEKGVQTDGSSVVLPKIADLSNGRLDLIPDTTVNWYVDYDVETGVGTLRIPAFLYHNGTTEVGSRYMLKEAAETFKSGVLDALREHPYALKWMGVSSIDDVEAVELTGATELEFWVQTPEDKANREQLSTSQELKEQYWQRTRGPVRTALEETLVFLDAYGIRVEMGHKEVGGIKAKLGASGHYDHIMEQLEIDWRFASLMQAADNELMVRNTVKDLFRSKGLEVTFMAKPIIGVAGSGEHHHLGATLRLKDGRRVNLFDCLREQAEGSAVQMNGDIPSDRTEGEEALPGPSYLSPVGFGALMGLLKNYEAVNAFVACTNDALNRLKPGFEAPVCVVTSLGKDLDTPSRNRTVLVGLIRDLENPMATRFELRSPCPKSNSYLVFASAYLAMLDGIVAVLAAEKEPLELEASLSKKPGDEDFYLETDRAYRAEVDVFDGYTEEERNAMFGEAPGTVYETLACAAPKFGCLGRCKAFTVAVLDSYRAAMLNQWVMELHNRIVPQTMDLIRKCTPHHDPSDVYDEEEWIRVDALRKSLGKTTAVRKSLLARIVEALDARDYGTASDLQKIAQAYKQELEEAYRVYEKNLL